MPSAGSLVVNLGLNSRPFSKGLQRSTKGLAGFAKRAIGIGTKIAAVALPAIAGVGFVNILKTANSFQQKMANSLAIMGDIGPAMRKNMVSAAHEVAAATKFSAKEAAGAYFFLASAGLDAKKSIEALPTVALFAQAGTFGLALATDLLTDALSAVGLASKDATKNLAGMNRVSDVLVKANTLANATVQQFSESLTNKAGAALRSTNKSIEEGVAVLAVFSDQGLKGAASGTALGIVLRDLQTKAINNKAGFAQMGIAVFNAQGSMNSMANIIGDMESALGGMSTEQKKTTLLQLGFSDKSVGFINSLLGTSKAIADYEKKLKLAGGTTADVASKQMTPFAAAMNKVRAAWEKFSITIGTPILEAFATGLRAALPILKSLAASGIEFGESIGGAITEIANNPLFKQFLATMGAGFTAVKEVALAAFGVVKTAVVSAFQSMWNVATTIFPKLNDLVKSLGTNIGERILNGLLVAEFAFKNWREFAVLEILKTKLGVVQLGNDIAHIFTKVVPAHLDFFLDNWRTIFTDMLNFTKTVFKNLTGNISSSMTKIWEFIKSGGTAGLKFIWTPLTSGLKAELKKLPDIPKRAMSQLEASLIKDIMRTTKRLGEEFVKFAEKRKLELGIAEPDVDRPPVVAPKPMGAKMVKNKENLDRLTTTGDSVSNIVAGLKKGSLEAARAIQAAGNVARNKLQKETAKNTKKTVEVLAEVKKVLKNIDKKTGVQDVVDAGSLLPGGT